MEFFTTQRKTTSNSQLEKQIRVGSILMTIPKEQGWLSGIFGKIFQKRLL